MTARFITAPDKITHTDEERKKILILDVEWHEIENLALLAMTKQVFIDFYLYGPTSIDKKWLDQAAKESDVILINTLSDRHIEEKNKLKDLPKVIELGKKPGFETPLEYIIKQIEDK